MKIYKENNEAEYPAVIVQDDVAAAPVGFTEVTDIEGIAKYGLQAVDKYTPGWRDRKAVRDKLKVAIYTKMQVAAPADVENPVNWNRLTAPEKHIATHYFLVGNHDFQNEVVNDRAYWAIEAGNYREWTMGIKEHRLAWMEATVFLALVDVQDSLKVLEELDQITKGVEEFIFDLSNKLVKSVKTKRLARLYVNGIQSQASDGIAGLEDWVNSTAGTPFEGNGLRSITYPMRGTYTANSLADEILEIINGTW